MSKIFVFEFSVMDDDGFVYRDGVAMHYDDADIKKFAKVLKGKGEDFMASDLPLRMQKPIIDAVIDQFAEKMDEEFDIDIEDWGVQLEGPLPVNLVHACNLINGVEEVDDSAIDFCFDPIEDSGRYIQVPVNLEYTVCHNGEVFHESCPYGLNGKIVWAMLEIAPEKPEGMSDFDYLKEKAPEMYAYVANDIYIWSNNKHLRDWGVCEEISLSDFPTEIYENYD